MALTPGDARGCSLRWPQFPPLQSETDHLTGARGLARSGPWTLDASLLTLSNPESCSYPRAFALVGPSAQMLTLASYRCSDVILQ